MVSKDEIDNGGVNGGQQCGEETKNFGSDQAASFLSCKLEGRYVRIKTAHTSIDVRELEVVINSFRFTGMVFNRLIRNSTFS